MAPVSWVISQRGRPPFPVERRPNSLVCASFNPSLQLGKERVEASGSRRPGAMDSSVGSFSPRAPETVQVERRLAWRTIACPPKDQPRSLLRLLEQGPESQRASCFCSGGVSAVISASDFGDHTLHPLRRTAYPLTCSLPSDRNPPTLRPAWLKKRTP